MQAGASAFIKSALLLQCEVLQRLCVRWPRLIVVTPREQWRSSEAGLVRMQRAQSPAQAQQQSVLGQLRTCQVAPARLVGYQTASF